jgi:hypothetical protein
VLHETRRPEGLCCSLEARTLVREGEGAIDHCREPRRLEARPRRVQPGACIARRGDDVCDEDSALDGARITVRDRRDRPRSVAAPRLVVSVERTELLNTELRA